MTNYAGSLAISGSLKDSLGQSGSFAGTLGVTLTASVDSAGTGVASETVIGGVTFEYTGLFGISGGTTIPFNFSTPDFPFQQGSFQVDQQTPISLLGADFGVLLNGSLSSNEATISDNLLATVSGTYDLIPFSATISGTGTLQSTNPSIAPITIAGTTPNQTTSDTSSLSPLQNVVVTDPNPGATDTATVTLSSAEAGTLTNLGAGSFNAGTGVYTVSGTPAAVTTALDGLQFRPSLDQGPEGQAVTTSFSIHVTDTAGATATTNTISVAATETSPTFDLVQAASQAILRTAPATSSISQIASQIDAGLTTLAQSEGGIITGEQALYTSLAALVTIDGFYNATPSSTTLTTVAAATGGTGYATATELHNLGYSDPNVWTILGAGWGADHNSSFFGQYGSDATGTAAGYTAFLDAAYQNVFGAAPTAANLQNLLADVPGLTALLSGGGNTATPIQVMGGLLGYLLYAGQANNVGHFASAADAFLQAAANGTVTYGPELTREFPSGTTGSSADGAAEITISGGVPIAVIAGVPPIIVPPVLSVITVSSSNQLIDPGAGDHTISFIGGSGADTLVLNGGGVDQVSGFNPATDVLDISALLSAAKVNLNGDVAALGSYLTITDQGGDAVINFDPMGHGGGTPVAVLPGLGSFDTLLTASAITGDGLGGTVTNGPVLVGPISITSDTLGDIVTLTNEGNGITAVVAAVPGGDTITVDLGSNNLGGSFSASPATFASTFSTALGAGDTINLHSAASFGAFGSSATDLVWVGGGSTVNLGTSLLAFGSPTTGNDTATVAVMGDVTGATSGNSPAMTVITGFSTAGANGQLWLQFDNSTNVHAVALTTPTSAPTFAFAGNSAIFAQVNEASATSLANALDIAASQTVLIDAIAGGGHTGVTNGVAQLNAHTALADWFQFGGNTYVVEALNTSGAAAAHTALAATDVVVELTGLVNVATAIGGGHLHFV